MWLRGLRAKRLRRRVGAAPAPPRRRSGRRSHGARTPRSGSYYPILRRGTTLRPLVPSAYNRSRLWTKPAFIRAASTPTCSRTVTAHDEHHEELGFWRKYVFSVDHKVIGIQYTITGLLFLLFGFTLMMLMRWQLAYPGRPIPLIGMWLGQDARAGRHHAARVLQPARRDARHHHGVPRRRAARGRRLRQLRDAAADRRARHGVPQAQHDELLGVLPRRRDHARQLLPAGRRRAVRAGRRIRRSRSSRPARRCG